MMSQGANTLSTQSLLVKLVMLATAALLILWIGWPGSEEPLPDPTGSVLGEVTAGPGGIGFNGVKPVAAGKVKRPGAGFPQGSSIGSPWRLNLNKATVGELQALPGVGPVLAGRIAERREKRGPFQQIEELREVKGISQKRMAQLRPLVQVGEEEERKGVHEP